MPIKDLLPTFRVSLLAGVRDSGKTRFILPAMIDWRANGGPPWAYIAADRSLYDAQATIADMGYPPTAVPLIPFYGRHKKPGWVQIVEAAQHTSPPPQVLIVEAFQDLADSVNQRRAIHEFMNWVDSYLPPSPELPRGLSVLGLGGSPKQSMKYRYPDPTQRVMGASVWVERASTVFVIESADVKHLSLVPPQRTMHVCRKVGSRLELSGAFTSDNRLVFPNL